MRSHRQCTRRVYQHPLSLTRLCPRHRGLPHLPRHAQPYRRNGNPVSRPNRGPGLFITTPEKAVVFLILFVISRLLTSPRRRARWPLNARAPSARFGWYRHPRKRNRALLSKPVLFVFLRYLHTSELPQRYRGPCPPSELTNQRANAANTNPFANGSTTTDACGPPTFP